MINLSSSYYEPIFTSVNWLLIKYSMYTSLNLLNKKNSYRFYIFYQEGIVDHIHIFPTNIQPKLYQYQKYIAIKLKVNINTCILYVNFSKLFQYFLTLFSLHIFIYINH